MNDLPHVNGIDHVLWVQASSDGNALSLLWGFGISRQTLFVAIGFLHPPRRQMSETNDGGVGLSGGPLYFYLFIDLRSVGLGVDQAKISI